MITISILTIEHKPVEAGIPFQLVDADCTVISSAKTDVSGVITFDVDPANVSKITGIRLDLETLAQMDQA